jgi:hypothetical protein
MTQFDADMPRWTIKGICTEARELKSKKGDVWAYSVRLVAMGGTFELQTRDAKLYRQFGEGATYFAQGVFDFFNNSIKLIVTDAKDAGK